MNMAKLVGICRTDDYPYERRQIPLVVDDKLTMVIQFTDSCIGCEQGGVKMKDLERFVQKFHAFTSDEVSTALMVINKEFFNLLTQMVPCVGCRRSVERLYSQLVESGHPALEPLVLTRNSVLSIKREYLFDPKAIYALFYVHGSQLNVVMESIPKSKKNKRCMLHSMDTHKVKSLGTWLDVWDVMSKECREEVVLVECDSLMDTIQHYLRKHRFCSECKSKVLHAYNLLSGEADQTKEKSYCPTLYDGLKCCPGEKKHIHVSCETDFMSHLISRAELELAGSRRERHAKTLDIAQEEVLTCLGIYLFERLHKIWQKLRAEEQTWQILFYVGVDALKKSFEVALEKKQGISNLELMCQELLEEEQAKEQKREQKRQKKKGKKKKNHSKIDNEIEAEKKDKENCNCDENSPVTLTICVACDDNSNHLVSQQSCATRNSRCHFQMDNDHCAAAEGTVNSRSCRSDCGYSSGHDSCSAPSSQDGSDVGCSDSPCNHSADSPVCHRMEIVKCKDCQDAKLNVSPVHGCDSKCDVPGGCGKGKCAAALSLQEMLAASSEGEEEFISEEEIERFKANQSTLNSKRQELRETLRQRFANMQRRGCLVPKPDDPDVTKLSLNK